MFQDENKDRRTTYHYLVESGSDTSNSPGGYQFERHSMLPFDRPHEGVEDSAIQRKPEHNPLDIREKSYNQPVFKS